MILNLDQCIFPEFIITEKTIQGEKLYFTKWHHLDDKKDNTWEKERTFNQYPSVLEEWTKKTQAKSFRKNNIKRKSPHLENYSKDVEIKSFVSECQNIQYDTVQAIDGDGIDTQPMNRSLSFPSPKTEMKDINNAIRLNNSANQLKLFQSLLPDEPEAKVRSKNINLKYITDSSQLQIWKQYDFKFGEQQEAGISAEHIVGIIGCIRSQGLKVYEVILRNLDKKIVTKSDLLNFCPYILTEHYEKTLQLRTGN